MDANALRERVAELSPWFHNIDLGHGVWTAPEHFLGDYPGFKFRRQCPHVAPLHPTAGNLARTR